MDYSVVLLKRNAHYEGISVHFRFKFLEKSYIYIRTLCLKAMRFLTSLSHILYISNFIKYKMSNISKKKFEHYALKSKLIYLKKD